jgi:transcriptional/translational regulatory protein YebC/TACO1
MKEAELIKEANVLKKLSGDELEKVNSAIEKLEDHDDVQNVWSDLE